MHREVYGFFPDYVNVENWRHTLSSFLSDFFYKWGNELKNQITESDCLFTYSIVNLEDVPESALATQPAIQRKDMNSKAVKFEWDEIVKPTNALKLFSLYYSPETEIFYFNSPKYGGAIPFINLKTFEKILNFKISDDFIKRAVSFKISGKLDYFLYENKDVKNTDNFELLINLLQNHSEIFNVDINEATRILKIFVDLVDNIKHRFTFIFNYEYWLGPSCTELVKRFNSKSYLYSSCTDSTYDNEDIVENKAFNREELFDFFLLSSSSLDVAEKSMKEHLELVKDVTGGRAISAFDKSVEKRDITRKYPDIGYSAIRAKYSRGLTDRKFSVIFNKISKILLKEVS